MKNADTGRIDALRRVEESVFTYCSVLLVEESVAAAAAKKVLLDLFANDCFWNTEGADRESFVKKRSIAIALQTAANNLKLKSPVTT
ncbi:hypothetical protein [Cohnella soli]|uniref:Uncharacterized protein n=1 Tax=Cohnella soli TaxID=425005 RepID=A0ABW0HU32_9BACL